MLDAEDRKKDGAGIPDVYEQDKPGYHLRMAALYDAGAAEYNGLAEVAGGGDVTDDGPA